VTVSWTVTNSGTGAGTTSAWTDSIIVSRNSVLGDGDDQVLANVTHSGGLAKDASYTKSQDLILPPEFNGRFTLFVRTDSLNQVFENGADANRTALIGNFDITPIPYADLRVEAVTAPASGQSGRELELSWRVKNHGIALPTPPNGRTGSSSPRTPMARMRRSSGRFSHLGFLAAGGDYLRTAKVVIPEGFEGAHISSSRRPAAAVIAAALTSSCSQTTTGAGPMRSRSA
jgi:hypothetical protein